LAAVELIELSIDVLQLIIGGFDEFLMQPDQNAF